MAISREELKKLVIKEMLEQDLKNEGVSDWLRSKASSVLTTTGKKMTQAGEKVAPKPEKDPEFLRDLSKIADFIQMYRDSKTVTDSEFYQKFVMGMKEELKEQYQSQFLKQILSKEPTVADVQEFVNNIASNKQLSRELRNLKLKKFQVPEVPVATSKAAEPAVQQTQTGDTEVSDSIGKTAATTAQDAAPTAAAQPAEVPDVVSGTEVTTKNAKIKFLPPVDEEPQAAQQIAKANADKLGVLKKKFDSGGVLKAKEKDELLRLLGALPKPEGRKPAAAKKVQKTLPESLQQIIAEEIFNLLTGKIK